MAHKFIQSKLPFSSKDAEAAIKEMTEGLAKLDKEFGAVKTDARSIGQRLTVKRAGPYPGAHSSDPVFDGALKKTVDVLEEHKRLAAAIPAKALELEELRKKAEERKAHMADALADAASNDIDIADKFPADLMLIMIQAVTSQQGSLDFLRGLSSEHRRLLLTKEEMLAEHRKAQQASLVPESDYGDSQKVIPATQAEEAEALVATKSEHLELQRQLADLKEKLAAEERANVRAQQELLNNLSEAKKAADDRQIEQKKLLASSEACVDGLKAEAGELRARISELEAGVISQDDLKAELDASRVEVNELKAQAEKMEKDLADKPVLEKKCAQLEEEVGALEMEKADLGQDLLGKKALLEANVAAKESAQKLADQCKTDLDQKTGELEKIQTLLGKTQKLFDLSVEREQRTRDDYLTEHDLCKETLAQLNTVQGKYTEKEAEVEKLEAVVTSRDREAIDLEKSIRSKDEEIGLKDEQIRDQGKKIQVQATELLDLAHMLGDKEDELKEDKKSLARSKADGEEARKGKESLELDLGFALSLSIRAGDVHVQDWIPLLRSLRDSVTVQVSPEHTPAPVWAVLPSWTGSSSDEEASSESFELAAVPSTPYALLFELFGHAVAEGDIRGNACLRTLATLSAQVGRHGLTKVGSFVIVLGKLVARVQGLGSISGYHRMLLLGMKYLAALLRSLVSEADAGLSSVEASLDGLMERAGGSLGVVRHVSDALCGPGDIQACESEWSLRLDSSEGRSLLFFAEPHQRDGLFLLADPEQRTIRAVSTRRFELKLVASDRDLANSAVIKAPAGQPDTTLALTDEDVDWTLEYLY